MIPNMDPRDASASKKVLVDWESTNLTQEDCADLAAYGNIPSGPTFLSAPGARGPGAQGAATSMDLGKDDSGVSF